MPDPKLIQELFLKIVALPPAEREAVLEQECDDKTEIRKRVAALLKAHDEPDSFLDDSNAAFEATLEAPSGSKPSASLRGRSDLAPS